GDENVGVLVARAAEEAQRAFEILRDEASLLAEALRREVVGVAAVWRLARLHEPLFDRPLQQSVDEPDGDTDLVLELLMRQRLAALDGGEEVEIRVCFGPSGHERSLPASQFDCGLVEGARGPFKA